MKTVRILTYHDLPNNGSALQCYAVWQALKECFPQVDVQVYAYSAAWKTVYEILKVLQIQRRAPFFNFARYLRFQRFRAQHFALDRTIPRFAGYERAKAHLIRQTPDMLVVGSETFWRLSRKWNEVQFPNIFWLPKEVHTKKVAFSASAIQSDPQLVETSMGFLRDVLSGFDLIGTRDQYTYDLVRRSGAADSVPVERVPDATFLFNIPKTDVVTILADEGIDLDRPIFGMAFYGRETFSRGVVKHFKERGFQVIALGMYNDQADINLGHKLDPLQWAEVFRYLSFCITDRFHGSIFCLKNSTPFVSIEPRSGHFHRNSKNRSLLDDCQLVDLYESVDGSTFRLDDFLQKCSGIIENWETYYEPKVREKVTDMRSTSSNFVQRIKSVLNS